MMDLDSMIRILNNSKASKHIETERIMNVHTISFITDKDGNIMDNEINILNSLTNELTIIGDFYPRRTSYWLNYYPEHPGYFHLSQDHIDDVKEILMSFKSTIKEIDNKTYKSPIQSLHFLMGNKFLPPYYKEYKKIIIHVIPGSIDLLSSEMEVILDVNECFYNSDYVLSVVHPELKFEVQFYFDFFNKKVKMIIINKSDVFTYYSKMINSIYLYIYRCKNRK